MRKLSVFNSVSLDGYFTDSKGDMSWAHNEDAEWNAFAAENASGDAMLFFGRVTYELMANYWPSDEAREASPQVAAGMNRLPKVVFSTTLDHAPWEHTQVISGNIEGFVREIKQQPGPDMVIMGSGTIVSQLTEASPIDEYRVIVCPIILGSGRTLFDGVTRKITLSLTDSRIFKNGNAVLTYQPEGYPRQLDR